MPDQKTLQKFRFFNERINRLIKKAKKISLPGFDRVPIYNVISFFFKGFQRGSLVTRASSIAFNLCLAIFPTLILLFTLIPYIPIENLQDELLKLFGNILPENAYLAMESTLVEVLTQKSGGLLSLGLIATLIFSTNGIHALISAFNVTSHSFDTRSWLTQRLISFVLVFILLFLLSIAIFLIVFSKAGLNKLIELGFLRVNIKFYLLEFGKWIIIIAVIFFAISFLYYLAPAKKTKWRFISAGSSLATILFIISSLGFSFFVNNFGQYNKIYGSIGTLIVILLWMYLNAITLLIGFELNVSISSANLKNKGIFFN